MYAYDEHDRALVAHRVAEFRDQAERRLKGELAEDEFKPLRLMNGLYLQLHAYMLRVAIPYGVLSPRQLRQMAHVARAYDKGYAHFTTRQNVQFNWVTLKDAPDILADLAAVDMHAIQTSGNTIRNTTTDHFAGAAADELEDPRPWCELIRQWSTLHPEFSFLPRKFKIAVTAAPHDRAAVRVHDIGLHMRANAAGEVGFEVIVGGGQGRTPYVGETIRDWLPKTQLLSYLEAILRVYNREGRRDNKYKARIKILVAALGADGFRDAVEAEHAAILAEPTPVDAPPEELARIADNFTPPPFEKRPAASSALEAAKTDNRRLRRWADTNLHDHKQAGYVSAVISLKLAGGIPGDADADQLELVADLAERYSFGEARVTHRQNLVLPHIALDDAPAVFAALDAAGLGEANYGLVSDIIACPGLDYCNLANARSIPIAQAIAERFADADHTDAIGPVSINVSGCINACGHHHVAHIGVLGVDKRGVEHYQITLGGRSDERAAVGKITGPALPAEAVADGVERLIDHYLAERQGPDETFVEALERLGHDPFKEALYANA